MTIKEAIRHLGTYSTTMGSGQTTDKQHKEAKEIAIKVLENLGKTKASDHISRAKLFDKLATVNGEDANDMKAKIYAVIQEMETEPDPSCDWVELHDHISKNMEQLRLQVRESMARISESIREAMQAERGEK